MRRIDQIVLILEIIENPTYCGMPINKKITDRLRIHLKNRSYQNEGYLAIEPTI